MFRFTIRDVLWLTVVVSLGAGWILDHSYQLKRREEFFEKLVEAVDRINKLEAVNGILKAHPMVRDSQQ